MPGIDAYACRLEDEAEVVLDICLAAAPTAARVTSRLVHGTDVEPLHPALEVSHHGVGTALLYEGDVRHSRVVGGPERLHLVLWCRSSTYRKVMSYDGDEDYRLYGPLAHEYNEVGVPGPGDHDGAVLDEADVPLAGRLRPTSARRSPRAGAEEEKAGEGYFPRGPNDVLRWPKEVAPPPGQAPSREGVVFFDEDDGEDEFAAEVLTSL